MKSFLGLGLFLAYSTSLFAEADYKSILSIQTLYSQNKNLTSHVELANTGANSNRDAIKWLSVEATKGKYAIPALYTNYINNVKSHGMNLHLVLVGGNSKHGTANASYPKDDAGILAFANFSKYVAQSLKGKVSQFELWNEWPYSQAEYIKLLKAVSPAVMAGNSSAVLVSDYAAMGDRSAKSLQLAKDSGVFSLAAGLSVHPYVYQGYGRFGRSPEAIFAYLNDLQESIKPYNAGKEFPFYITEFGWPINGIDGGTDLKRQANFLSRGFILSKTVNYIKMMSAYNLINDCEDPYNNECNFGLMNKDLSLKPSYLAVRDTLSHLKNVKYVGPVFSNAPEIIAHEFIDALGVRSLIVWNTNDDASVKTKISISAGRLGNVISHNVGEAPKNNSNIGGYLSHYISGKPTIFKNIINNLAQFKVTVAAVPMLHSMVSGSCFNALADKSLTVAACPGAKLAFNYVSLQTYQISVGTLGCLDSSIDGKVLSLKPCQAVASQNFRIEPFGNDYMEIMSMNSKKCLTAPYSISKPAVSLLECKGHADANTLWMTSAYSTTSKAHITIAKEYMQTFGGRCDLRLFNLDDTTAKNSVRYAYCMILKRNVSGGNFVVYTKDLDTGAKTIQQILTLLYKSDERWKNFKIESLPAAEMVDYMFKYLLQRNATSAEVTLYADKLTKKTLTHATLFDTLIHSSEFVNKHALLK